MGRRLFDLLVFGNLLIAVSAMFLTMATQMVIWHKLTYHPYLLLIFFATWFVYNSHRVWAIFRSRLNSHTLPYRDQWAFQNRSFMYVNTLFSLVGLCVYAFLCKLRVGLFMLPLGVFALGYTFPIIGKNMLKSGLRSIPVLKTFFIAAVWAIVTVFIPVVFGNNSWNIDKGIYWLAAERFLFIFAITLPFEMRDIADDKSDGIKTIAVLLGFEKTLKLAKILIFVFWAICIIHYTSNFAISSAMVLSAFSTWLLIKNTKSDNSEYFFLFWLDGTMIMQFLLVLAASLY